MCDKSQKSCSSVALPKSQKRKRDPTFTNNEKRNLIEIVEEHFKIIECKRTDALSSRAKSNEWMAIAAQFNSTTDHIPRDVQSLKTLWDNLKKKAKATMTIINGNRYASGGGPSKEPKKDPNIDKVISLIKTDVQGFTNIYDSDTKIMDYVEDETSPQTQEESQDHQEHGYNRILAAEVPLNGDWRTYTQALLRTPRARVLTNKSYTVKEVQQDLVNEVEIPSVQEEVCGELQPATVSPPATPNNNCSEQPILSVNKSTRHLANRRRPVLKESEAVALATTKIKVLQSSVEQSKQQHEIALRCLLLQEEQEKEKLKQEQEKTEQEILKKQILLAELKKITNQSTV